jgi:hypothetical protein
MYRKLIMGLAPLVAVVAFAMISTAAQGAEPKWFHCQPVAAGTGRFSDALCTKEVAKGNFELKEVGGPQEKQQVKTHGSLTLTTVAAAIVCQVRDTGTIWNEGGFGRDQVKTFVTENCKPSVEKSCPKPTVVVSNLPWQTKLFRVGTVIRDKIVGVHFTLECPEKFPFEGQLEPKYVNSEPSFLEFDKESGHVTNGTLGEATLSGNDFVESGPQELTDIIVVK